MGTVLSFVIMSIAGVIVWIWNVATKVHDDRANGFKEEIERLQGRIKELQEEILSPDEMVTRLSLATDMLKVHEEEAQRKGAELEEQRKSLGEITRASTQELAEKSAQLEKAIKEQQRLRGMLDSAAKSFEQLSAAYEQVSQKNAKLETQLGDLTRVDNTVVKALMERHRQRTQSLMQRLYRADKPTTSPLQRLLSSMSEQEPNRRASSPQK